MIKEFFKYRFLEACIVFSRILRDEDYLFCSTSDYDVNDPNHHVTEYHSAHLESGDETSLRFWKAVQKFANIQENKYGRK